jgi:hypothetical protein
MCRMLGRPACPSVNVAAFLHPAFARTACAGPHQRGAGRGIQPNRLHDGYGGHEA